jgi:hypothetical protein
MRVGDGNGLAVTDIEAQRPEVTVQESMNLTTPKAGAFDDICSELHVPRTERSLRAAACAPRLHRRRWSKATWETFSAEAARNVSFWHELALVLGGTSGSRQPKEFVTFLAHTEEIKRSS